MSLYHIEILVQWKRIVSCLKIKTFHDVEEDIRLTLTNNNNEVSINSSSIVKNVEIVR
jgi:hypothetical protein